MNIELHLAFRLKDHACAALVERYCVRAQKYRRMQVIENSNNAKLKNERNWRVLCALDGELLSSQELATLWRQQEERGMTTAEWLIGGPDGWPGQVKVACRLAFGRMTMPHQLAAVVASEQLYRVLTMLAGHPYHAGHA